MASVHSEKPVRVWVGLSRQGLSFGGWIWWLATLVVPVGQALLLEAIARNLGLYLDRGEEGHSGQIFFYPERFPVGDSQHRS